MVVSSEHSPSRGRRRLCASTVAVLSSLVAGATNLGEDPGPNLRGTDRPPRDTAEADVNINVKSDLTVSATGVSLNEAEGARRGFMEFGLGESAVTNDVENWSRLKGDLRNQFKSLEDMGTGSTLITVTLKNSEDKEKSLTTTMDKIRQSLEIMKFKDEKYPTEAEVRDEVAEVTVKSMGSGETPGEKVEEINVDWIDGKKNLYVAGVTPVNFFADDENDENGEAKKIFDVKQGIKGPVLLVGGSDEDVVEALADRIEKVGGNEKMEKFQLLFTFSSGGKSNFDFTTKVTTIAGSETQAKDLAQFVKMLVDNFAYDKVFGRRYDDHLVPKDGVIKKLDTPHKQGLLTAELQRLGPRDSEENYTRSSLPTNFTGLESSVEYIIEIKDDRTKAMTEEHRYSRTCFATDIPFENIKQKIAARSPDCEWEMSWRLRARPQKFDAIVNNIAKLISTTLRSGYENEFTIALVGLYHDRCPWGSYCNWVQTLQLSTSDKSTKVALAKGSDTMKEHLKHKLANRKAIRVEKRHYDDESIKVDFTGESMSFKQYHLFAVHFTAVIGRKSG